MARDAGLTGQEVEILRGKDGEPVHRSGPIHTAHSDIYQQRVERVDIALVLGEDAVGIVGDDQIDRRDPGRVEHDRRGGEQLPCGVVGSHDQIGGAELGAAELRGSVTDAVAAAGGGHGLPQELLRAQVLVHGAHRDTHQW